MTAAYIMALVGDLTVGEFREMTAARSRLVFRWWAVATIAGILGLLLVAGLSGYYTAPPQMWQCVVQVAEQGEPLGCTVPSMQ
jgi:energy-converting hydrogenase Eha subunit G